MLSLPIITELKYISYSSFKQALGCEYEFYLMRLAGMPYMPFPQTRPMAMGYAFESFVKAEIARLLGKLEYKNKLAKLLENIQPEHQDIIAKGHELFEEYCHCGQLKRLIDEGVEDVELEGHAELGGHSIEGIVSNFGVIKIFGKPDAVMVDRPLDWKVNGFESKWGKSPTPGYVRSFTRGVDKGRHEKSQLPMELLDPEWATQMVFYNWLKKGAVVGPMLGAIEQVAISPTKVSFSSFRSSISTTFVEKIFDQLNDLWTRLKDGQINEPVPDTQKCEPYGEPKVCTVMCKYYQASSLNNPMDREIGESM